jgi:hypothetical protein
MKRILIERKPTLTTHCESFLTLPGVGVLAGIERPWIPDPAGSAGGKPFESCIPVGVYETLPHTRPDGAHVVALFNHELGVYYAKADRPNDTGRYLILLHVANWVSEVVGCCAPGLYHADNPNGRMVSSSGKAMRRIMNYIDGDDCEIEIRNI